MNNPLFVIAMAALSVVLTTWIAWAMDKRAQRPRNRRPWWALLAVGVVVPAGLAGLVLSAL